MTVAAARFDPATATLACGPVLLGGLEPMLDGAVAAHGGAVVTADGLAWTLDGAHAGARAVLAIEGTGDWTRLALHVEGLAPAAVVDAVGLRVGLVANVRQYLRNGYTSWDGSYFVEPEAARAAAAADPRITEGHAMTALLPVHGEGATVLGFTRHDRFQSRLRFAFADGPLAVTVETLWDRVPHEGTVAAEPLVVGHGPAVEEALRAWARLVAAESPAGARLPARRITGWCSWYNLYAAIDEPAIRHHLAAATRFRDERGADLQVFQIDDGFTPEMGDWLEVKPQFPRGMAPLLADIRAAGFVPGLWIAPFLVGNRSRLFAEHPDWVVVDRASGAPISLMQFHGEFRWHKRSEEYYVLDVTHPDAEAYIRRVFRTYAKDWGCGYFKTDFMHLGSALGPERARWHREGLSRIAIWMIMARLIREEIGDALWLACGSPIWAPVGLVDAMRTGRDVGVSWTGHYSAESLLRDQTSRNFANGILWQADPDCVLLRARFHDLTDDQIRSLATFAGLVGGVFTTSDDLGDIPPDRAELFARLAALPAEPCDFPLLGDTPLRYRLGSYPTGEPMAIADGDPLLVQRRRGPDGSVTVAAVNTGSHPQRRLLPWTVFDADRQVPIDSDGAVLAATDRGLVVDTRPFETIILVRKKGAP